MTDNIHLSLKGIRKSYEVGEVLKGIDLDIAQGEFITLLGSSGCGKTTTIRIIAGLEMPDEGRVILDGTDITDLTPEKRNVNTIFQNYALFPHMNVADNVSYALKIRKVGRAERRAKAEEMLKLVQLDGYGDRKVSELSGGQKQRVAIARALINEPKVLLLDEPLGALDLKLRRQMQLELKRMQKRLGITFIYITHDQEEAINMSDRIAVMNNGLFEQIGTPDEVYYRPKTSYVANFVGNANIIRENGKTFAVRSENVVILEKESSGGVNTVMDNDVSGETNELSAVKVFLENTGIISRNAKVLEKSFAGGQLRIEFELEDGQHVVASRSGINSKLEAGETTKIGWSPENAVEVIDDGI
ncbi:MAG: ABC transporter ATP-binding protein [Lachnospiraceae bacterium]|nr:ABC transporter ATP-binding protein [Lachnospiraceae bacterium]